MASPSDIDLAMLAGTGFPQDKGGPLHWADSVGLDVVVDKLKGFSKSLGPRFWPAPILKRMVELDIWVLKPRRAFSLIQEVNMGTFINVSIEGKVATVTINNPPVNALSSGVLKEMETLLDELKDNQEVKAIILTGVGQVFVAGADIKQMAKILTVEDGRAAAGEGHVFFSRSNLCPNP